MPRREAVRVVPRARRDRRTGRGRTDGRGDADTRVRVRAARPPAHPPFRAPPGPRSFAYGPFIHKNPREGGAGPAGCGAPGHGREGAPPPLPAPAEGLGLRGGGGSGGQGKAREGGSAARPSAPGPGGSGSGAGAGGGTHDVADPAPGRAGRRRFVNRRAAAPPSHDAAFIKPVTGGLPIHRHPPPPPRR